MDFRVINYNIHRHFTIGNIEEFWPKVKTGIKRQPLNLVTYVCYQNHSFDDCHSWIRHSIAKEPNI